MGHRIPRIDHQVQQRRFELVGVGQRLRQRQWKPRLDPHRRPDRPLQHVAQPVHQVDQADCCRVQVLPPRKGQHPLRQRGAALGRLRGIVHQRHQFRLVRHAPAQQFETAQHHHQQIVEIVRHAAGQLADRLQLLRLDQRLARLFQRALRFMFFGDVAGDLGEADQFALVVPDRVDHHMGPEERAVLSDPPCFILKAPGCDRGLQAALRLASRLILLAIEAREMLTDDLVRPIALDALRAGIPARDMARRVEHVDRIVRDALDQQLELLLAAPQRFGGGFSLAQIPRDLGVAEQFARRGPDRVDHHMRPEPAALLVDPPVLGFEPALAAGLRQLRFRHRGGAVFIDVDPGEVLPDDLGRRVSHAALRAGVPAGDDPRRVQHVDGVVGDAFDEQSITPVGQASVHCFHVISPPGSPQQRRTPRSPVGSGPQRLTHDGDRRFAEASLARTDGPCRGRGQTFRLFPNFDCSDGANLGAARNRAMFPKKIYQHPQQHAGYFVPQLAGGNGTYDRTDQASVALTRPANGGGISQPRTGIWSCPSGWPGSGGGQTPAGCEGRATVSP